MADTTKIAVEQRDPIDVIAKALDPQAWEDTAWWLPDMDRRSKKYMQGLQRARQEKMDATAQRIYVALLSAGFNVAPSLRQSE